MTVRDEETQSNLKIKSKTTQNNKRSTILINPLIKLRNSPKKRETDK